jgi:hypothetical protein
MTMIRSLISILAVAAALSAISNPALARACTANSTTCQTVWKNGGSTIYRHDNGTYYECGGSGCQQL